MEFEKDTPASDVDRRLAEAKKLTLEPLHTDLAPDDEPDAAVIARHLAEGALANAPNDTEQSTAPIKPSSGVLDPTDESKAIKHGKVIVAAVTAFIVIGIITTAVIISSQA